MSGEMSKEKLQNPNFSPGKKTKITNRFLRRLQTEEQLGAVVSGRNRCLLLSLLHGHVGGDGHLCERDEIKGTRWG